MIVYVRLILYEDDIREEFDGVFSTLEEAQKIRGPKDPYHTRRKWKNLTDDKWEWGWRWYRIKTFHVEDARSSLQSENVDSFLRTLQTLMSSGD